MPQPQEQARALQRGWGQLGLSGEHPQVQLELCDGLTVGSESCQGGALQGEGGTGVPFGLISGGELVPSPTQGRASAK